LTFLLSTIGFAIAFPLAIVLALGRRSELPAIKGLCVAYIELIRGVPLVTFLFMAAVMFPLFVPQGVTVDKLLRAQVALAMFIAAYVARFVADDRPSAKGNTRPPPASVFLTGRQRS
jgi:general L-amino acid transport system permease protein